MCTLGLKGIKTRLKIDNSIKRHLNVKTIIVSNKVKKGNAICLPKKHLQTLTEELP